MLLAHLVRITISLHLERSITSTNTGSRCWTTVLRARLGKTTISYEIHLNDFNNAMNKCTHSVREINIIFLSFHTRTCYPYKVDNFSKRYPLKLCSLISRFIPMVFGAIISRATISSAMISTAMMFDEIILIGVVLIGDELIKGMHITVILIRVILIRVYAHLNSTSIKNEN